MREKIQASTFSSADMYARGSSQLPKPSCSTVVFSLFLGEDPFHRSEGVILSFPSPPILLFTLGPAVTEGITFLVVWHIIVLNTIELDNQNVNLQLDARGQSVRRAYDEKITSHVARICNFSDSLD